MTMLSKEALDEFKKLYKEHFGVDLSDQEALDKGIRLIKLVEVVCKVTAQNESEKHIKDCHEQFRDTEKRFKQKLKNRRSRNHEK